MSIESEDIFTTLRGRVCVSVCTRVLSASVCLMLITQCLMKTIKLELLQRSFYIARSEVNNVLIRKRDKLAAKERKREKEVVLQVQLAAVLEK